MFYRIKKVIVIFSILALALMPFQIVLEGIFSEGNIIDKFYQALKDPNVIDNFSVKKAEANTSFVPSTGAIVTGTDAFHSWKQTLMPDNVGLATFATTLRSWAINTTTSGLNVNLTVPNIDVSGTGTNKLIVNTRWQTSATTLTPIRFQICDWVSLTGVDAAADAQCTTGGWRTLNFGKQDITPGAAGAMYWNHRFVSATAGHGTPSKIGGPSNDSSLANAGLNSMPAFEVFNGYFADASGNPVSTPLTNFVSSGNVKVRVFSTVATASLGFAWDYLSVEPTVDTSILPATRTLIAGTEPALSPVNTYARAFSHEPTPLYHQINSLTASPFNADIVYRFNNISSYTGANTILVNLASLVATQTNYSVYICNFNAGACAETAGVPGAGWETLNNAVLTNTAVAANHFSKYSAAIANYISSGQARVRIRTTGTAAGNLQIGYLRLTLGSTNTDTGQAEVSLGALVSGSISTNTQTLDTTKTLVAADLYQANQVLATQANLLNTYSYDCVGVAGAAPTMCATTAAGVAMNLKVPIAQPANTIVTGIRFAERYRSNNSAAATLTVLGGIRDYGGTSSVGSLSAVTAPQLPQTNILGGFLDVGTIATSSLIYSDGILTDNPQNKIDTTNNQAQMRLRTAATTLTAALATPTDWDFAFTSIRWYAPAAAGGQITVGTTGNQTTSMNIPSTNNYVGGAFTFVRDTGSANVTQMIVTDTGTVNANANLSNLDLYYETAGTCSYEGTETLFGTAASFNSSEKATVTGTMAVGTSQVCVYAVLDVGSGASAGQTVEIEISNPSTEVTVSAGTVSPATAVAIAGTTTLSSGNNNPNSPSSLAQKKTDDSVIATGGWINQTSVKFTATASDTDNPDTLYLCVEKDILGTSFSNTEDACGTGVAYSGTPVTVTVTIAGITDANEYHWQARVKDAANAYSGWLSYGGNLESERDFGIDTTAPTGGTVYDGTSGDQDWNDGALNSISSNWTGFNTTVSGLNKYEYAVRRSSDGRYWNTTGPTWQVAAVWYDNGTGTTVTMTPIYLNTGENYYFSVRATDNAVNTASPQSSNGQQVSPTLSFSLSGNTITFADLNNTNSWTDTKTSTTTTSTNASSGYTAKAYITQLLTSLAYPSVTIANFYGTWANPEPWPAGTYGFGYTSNDTLVQGSNRFNNATEYAAFSQTASGDVVADHTDAVNGQTGAVTNQQFTITYKVAVSQVQAASTYQTYAIYIVTANY